MVIVNRDNPLSVLNKYIYGIKANIFAIFHVISLIIFILK